MYGDMLYLLCLLRCDDLRNCAGRWQSIYVIGAQMLPVVAGLALGLEAHNEHRDRDTQHSDNTDCVHAKSLVVWQIHASRDATDKQANAGCVDQQGFDDCHITTNAAISTSIITPSTRSLFASCSASCNVSPDGTNAIDKISATMSKSASPITL
jgi:hypothetical protein